jgi:hypothetical protein
LAQTQPHHGGSVKTFQTRPWKAVFGDQKVLDMLSKRRGHSFETRPDLAGRPGTGRPGAGTGPGWRKNRGRKNQCDPVTRQDPVKNPVTTRWLFFLLKRRYFDFKKNWPERPGQNPEPGPWTGLGLKTMGAGPSHSTRNSMFFKIIFIIWSNTIMSPNYLHINIKNSIKRQKAHVSNKVILLFQTKWKWHNVVGWKAF